MFDVVLKPKKKRFPDEDGINHAVPGVLCDEDKTACYSIKVTPSTCLPFNNPYG
jgi:hypothetical protein